MIEFDLDAADYGRVRLGVSALTETTASLAALIDPVRARRYRGWAATAGRPARDARLELLPALLLSPWHEPDFLVGVGTDRRRRRFEDELEHVRGLPVGRFQSELAGIPDPRPVVRRALQSPEAGLALLAEELDRYHRAVIAPLWPRINARLEADLDGRSRAWARGGLDAVFTGLHERLGFRDGTLTVASAVDFRAKTNGEGVLLSPSLFLGSYLGSGELHGPLRLIYPIGGVSRLASDAPPTEADDDLARLIGRSRATLLAQLDHPMTAAQLAAALDVTAQAVSQHLTILRDNNLVTALRDGRRIFYQRTERATLLLE